MFFSLFFKHSDQNDFCFLVISKMFQSMTEKNRAAYKVTGHLLIDFC